jgi:hypothetical protein
VWVPGAGVEHEEGAVGGLNDIGQVGAFGLEREKGVFGGAVGGALGGELKTEDLTGVVEGDE